MIEDEKNKGRERNVVSSRRVVSLRLSLSFPGFLIPIPTRTHRIPTRQILGIPPILKLHHLLVLIELHHDKGMDDLLGSQTSDRVLLDLLPDELGWVGGRRLV